MAVSEKKYEEAVSDAERAAATLRKVKAKRVHQMHRVGQTATAIATAAALGVAEGYMGEEITVFATPIETIGAAVLLTAGAVGVGGDVVSEYVGAAGIGMGAVAAYKWGRASVDAVSGVAGDEGESVGATRRAEPRRGMKSENARQLGQRARVVRALPAGLLPARRETYTAAAEAQKAMRALGLAA